MLLNLNALGVAGIVIRTLRRFLSWNRSAYPACVRSTEPAGRGFPFAEKLIVHTTEDGKISLKPLRAEKEMGQEYITREELYSALGQISLPLESPPDEETSET